MASQRRDSERGEDALLEGSALQDPCGSTSYGQETPVAHLELGGESNGNTSRAESTEILVHQEGWTEEAGDEVAIGSGGAHEEDGAISSPPVTAAVWQPHWFVELLLFLVLGASGWWSSNIIGAEQPVFVHRTPESDKLSNLISVSLQIGNVFPIAYKVILSCRTGKSTESLLPYSIFVTLLVGCISLFVCAFFWDTTFVIFRQDHSVILLVCSFLSGGVGALSNVTYWALTSHFETRCIKALSTGMTFGGLIATGLALAQNAGMHPRFSVMVFMLIAGAIQVLVIGAFVPIMRLRRHHVNAAMPSIKAEKKISMQKSSSRTLMVVNEKSEDQQPLLPKKEPADSKRDSTVKQQISSAARYGSVNDSGIDESPPATPALGSLFAHTRGETSLCERVFSPNYTLVYISFLLYGMTYTIPSLMPFLADGYKAVNLDSNIYLWMLVLQNVGDVAGRLSTAFPWQPKLQHLVWIFATCVLLFAAFILATVYRDSLSDVLPRKAGYVLAVSCLLYYYCRGFLITSLYVYAKTNFPPKQAESLSTNLGFLGQIGALLANIVMFVIVNVCELLGS